MAAKNVVIIGGGTGSFTVLSSLRGSGHTLTAIVNMADHGGSSGTLRDELGVLPPGDIRQCLVALSETQEPLRKLFTHRFHRGGLSGHTLGNIFLAACEDLTGSFEKSVELAARVLQIRGSVLPVTLRSVELCARLENGEILRGEPNISYAPHIQKIGVKHLFLKPRADANPKAIYAIKQADVLLVAPGNLFGSLVPNFLARGIMDAIRKSSAKKIFIANLMTKKGQTEGFCVHRLSHELERLAGGSFIDTVIYNTKLPSHTLRARYRREGDVIKDDGESCAYRARGAGLREKRAQEFRGVPLLSSRIADLPKGDPLARHRSLIRHDKKLLCRALLSVI